MCNGNFLTIGWNNEKILQPPLRISSSEGSRSEMASDSNSIRASGPIVARFEVYSSRTTC